MIWPVEPAKFAAYVAVAGAMCFSPGPANLFAVATGMGRGRKALIAGVTGMNLASVVWYLAAALGLSALIAAFPRVFHIATLVGAAYLLFLAAQALIAAWQGGYGHVEAHKTPKARSAFLDGFIVQISNPKALLFLGAVLPPFLDNDRPLAGQFLVFAVFSIGIDFLAMTTYGLAGAALTARMSSPAFRRGFNIATGLVLAAVAAMIALRA